MLEAAGLLGTAEGVFAQPSINAFMALGPQVWSKVRARISALLRHDNAELRDNADLRGRALHPRHAVQLHLPLAVAGFTDFYSSKEHATNVGVMFRDKSNPLLPNWFAHPDRLQRPCVDCCGQRHRRDPAARAAEAADRGAAELWPSKRLDFELEMGIVIGQPSQMGRMLSEAEADAMIFGFTLLNDWSARDIQQWEYVPLGPFQGKAFATSISPWIVTREALEPFRVQGPPQEPQPLPYLRQALANNLRPHARCRPADLEDERAAADLPHQLQIHVLVVGAAARASCVVRLRDDDRRSARIGTISGPEKDQRGSLLELSWGGAEPLELGDERRTFLEDGDSLSMTGYCQGDGYRIGFGEVESTILPAV